MKFCIQNAFESCLPLLDETNSKKVEDDFFIKKMPPNCCAWDKGFYLQLYLVECSFYKYGMDQEGLSHLAVTYSSRVQEVKRGESVTSYPVIDFYLYINRDIFDVLPQMRLYRARCIAHELLILEGYTNHYGTTVIPPACPSVNLPNRHHEDELLCSFERIEATLSTIETEYSLSIHTHQDFIGILSKNPGNHYVKIWNDLCVDEQTCLTRTIFYLACAGRETLRARMERLFHKICDALKLKDSSSDEIKLRIRLNDAFYTALVDQSAIEIGEHATEPYLRFLVHRFLDQHWKDFRNSYWNNITSI